MNIELLQSVALAVAGERDLDAVLQRIVSGLARRDHIALARVWLIEPGDICTTCAMREECPDQTRCLHLVASAGSSQQLVAGAGQEAGPETGPKAAPDWSRTSGAFRRFPLHVRKIGHIGATGTGILIPDIAADRRWIAMQAWARSEGIQSFAGQPLVFRGDKLGVLAVFSRKALDETAYTWLRIFADHAAVAIANSRAFTEIERLREQLELENAYLKEELAVAHAPGGIVGQSAALQRVLRQVDLVAPTDASVLVLGESGTGKELIARAIHERSARRNKPLIKVNCSAIPRELFESEFFGHVKGAFTGALKDRTGRFQLADGGTLFLDEIGEIPLALQSKLLRVLQEGQLERVGDDETREVDVRIIAATNRDLGAEVERGRFRQDLYYRLSVFPLALPPLRERVEDIPLLAEQFVKLAAQRLGVAAPRLTRAQLGALAQYHWPGNVRELQHVIERALIVGRGQLDFELGERGERGERRERGPGHAARSTKAETVTAILPTILTDSELRQRERQNLQAALEHTRGKIYGPDGAAALLGIKPTTLLSRMKAMGIERP